MRKNFIFIASAAIAISACALFASPAATQNWVRNYVATNVAESASVSNSIMLVTKNAADGMTAVLYILNTDGSTNAVERAARSLVDSVRPVVESVVGNGINFNR